MNEIIVAIKDVYGNAKVYPVCDTAKMFTRIAGTKTLTEDALKCIVLLGYAVTVETVPGKPEFRHPYFNYVTV